MDDITIAPPQAGDKADWRRLYEGYATFYKRPMNDAIADRVWSWVTGGSGLLECLVARDAKGRVVGLAHFRQMPRPLTATMAGFLDDLFVDPAARGAGLADRLIEACADWARARDAIALEWQTALDNQRAQAVYERVGAKPSRWLDYELELTDVPGREGWRGAG
jgi:GNAT superfamily N-acetyltransferase